MRPQIPQDDVSDHRSIEDRLRRLEQADTIYTGAIVLWRSGVAVPNGWLTCDGTSFDPTTYPQLFALWGTSTLPAGPGLTGYVAIVRAR